MDLAGSWECLRGTRSSRNAAHPTQEVQSCQRRIAWRWCTAPESPVVLGSGNRDRPDAPTRLPLALAPDGGLRLVDPGPDGRGSRRPGPHDTLAPESVAQGAFP